MRVTTTNHTPTLLKYALLLTERIWRADIEFAKAGVLLTKLIDEDVVQLSLFDDYDFEDEQTNQLMKSIDELNLHYGQDVLRYAAMGTSRRWQTRAQYTADFK